VRDVDDPPLDAVVHDGGGEDALLVGRERRVRAGDEPRQRPQRGDDHPRAQRALRRLPLLGQDDQLARRIGLLRRRRLRHDRMIPSEPAAVSAVAGSGTRVISRTITWSGTLRLSDVTSAWNASAVADRFGS
jgi:hypothetical protein